MPFTARTAIFERSLMRGPRQFAAACTVLVVVVVAFSTWITLTAPSGHSAIGSPGTTPAPSPTPTPTATPAAAPASAAGASLRPPRIEIRSSKPGQAPGLMFVAPKKVFGHTLPPGAQHGLEIVDGKGRVRYFKPNGGHDVAQDFEVQTYEGKPVLTYWYGRLVNGSGHGYGVIMDTHYRRIATVHTTGGLEADFHEFKLTPQGTALMLAYHDRTYRGRQLTEGVLQEIDVKTGRVVTDWHSLPDVPVSATYEPQGTRSAAHFEYFHINAADLDGDGNILVSARHTWAIYKIQRHTGKLLWTLGGKLSDFELGPGVQTAWQHDVRSLGANELSIFDNGFGDHGAPAPRDYSRVVEIKLDPKAKTAKLVRQYKHPDGVGGGTQGNGQKLPNGDMFVGWGSAGVFSEFSPGGRLLFDARVPKGEDTYRAFKFVWHGTPAAKPALSAVRDGARIRAHMSWNGSTAVARWRLRAGRSRDRLRTVGQSRWKDLDTALTVARRGARYVQAEALDAHGRRLAASAVRRLAG